MNRRAAFRLFGYCLIAPVAASCGDGTKVGGPPTLRQLLLRHPAGELDLLAATDGGAPMAVPPTASITAVFDKLLDGDKIEPIVDGGATPREGIAQLRWEGAPAGAPTIRTRTSYNPGGSLGPTTPGPSIAILVEPGLPSGARLTLVLDRTLITDKAGQSFVGMDMLSWQTAPFSAAVSVMEGATVGPQKVIEIDFSNLLGPMPERQVQISAGGTALPVTPTVDPANSRRLVLSPPQASGWQPGAYSVRIAKEAADLFGVPLGADVVVAFTVSASGAADGGSPSPADGGAPSGSDGGADGGAPPDAASDVATGG